MSTGRARQPAPLLPLLLSLVVASGTAAQPATTTAPPTAAAWIDYMHLAKFDRRWVILNVVWENNPPAP